jgi:hypothetical protein
MPLLRLPKLVLKSTSTATTYYFKPAPSEEGHHVFGYALATVNDDTGELSVQSDWGKWSYQWNPRPHALGHPTLTEFIASRSTESHYLADKLWGKGYGGSRFSPQKTVEALRKKLAENRLEEGRHHLMLSEYGRRIGPFIDRMDAGAASVSAHKKRYYPHQSWTGSDGEPLTKGIARAIWDALEELDDRGLSEELFVERLYRIDGIDWIGEELWDQLEHEQDPAYTILQASIMPALQAACAQRANERRLVAPAEAQVQA